MKKTILLSFLMIISFTAFESFASSFDTTKIEVFESKQMLTSKDLVIIDSVNLDLNSHDYSFSAVILAEPLVIKVMKASYFNFNYIVIESDLTIISARNRGSPN